MTKERDGGSEAPTKPVTNKSLVARATERRFYAIYTRHLGTAGIPDHEEHCDLCFLVGVIEKLGGTHAVRRAYAGVTE